MIKAPIVESRRYIILLSLLLHLAQFLPRPLPSTQTDPTHHHPPLPLPTAPIHLRTPLQTILQTLHNWRTKLHLFRTHSLGDSGVITSLAIDVGLASSLVNVFKCIYTLPGHTSTIRCLRVLHNHPITVSGSCDCTLRVWDIQKGRCVRVLEGHTQSVRCLDVVGSTAVSGSYDTTCRVPTLVLDLG